MKKRSLSSCPIVFSLDLLGDKWSLVILRDILLDNKSHFSEFLASKEKIASNILSARLEILVTNGFLIKKEDPTNKSAAIYKPTDKALGLLPILFELVRWGTEHNQNSNKNDPLMQEVLTNAEDLRRRTIQKFSNN